MKVLVTGATGFIGSHVARALVEDGATVRLLRRDESPTELIADLPSEHVIGDILDEDSLTAACDGADGLVHCAAQMRGQGSIAARLESHVLGTRNVLAAAGRAGVRRLIYVSSVASLGTPRQDPSESDADVIPLDEGQAWHGPASNWPYGFAKQEAEQLVRQASRDGLEAVIVNPSLVIGPGDRNRVSNILVWHILRGRVPPLIPGGLNVVAIDDVAAGILAALDRGRAGERYILCGENRLLADLIRTTARLVGRREPRLRLSLAAARAVGSISAAAARLLRLPLAPELLRQAGIYFYYSGAKARGELALDPPRPYEPAARAAAEWYRGRLRR